MQLQIQAPEDLTHAARAAIERRVRLLLGSHAVGVERAQVTVFPADRGASGCRIRLRMRDGESLAVEDRAENPSSAASAAAWRLGHRVRRRQPASTDRTLASRRAGLR